MASVYRGTRLNDHALFTHTKSVASVLKWGEQINLDITSNRLLNHQANIDTSLPGLRPCTKGLRLLADFLLMATLDVLSSRTKCHRPNKSRNPDPFPVTQAHTHNSGCAVGDISVRAIDLIGTVLNVIRTMTEKTVSAPGASDRFPAPRLHRTKEHEILWQQREV